MAGCLGGGWLAIFVIGWLSVVGWHTGCLTSTLAGNAGPAMLLGGWLAVRIYGCMAG